MYVKIERLDKDMKPKVVSLFETNLLNYSYGKDGLLVEIEGNIMTFGVSEDEDCIRFFVMNNDGKTVDSFNWIP